MKKRTSDSASTFRGYFRSAFEDVWARYLPVRESATSATTATPGLWQESEDELLEQVGGPA